MKNEIDSIGEPKAVWVFYGSFPFAETVKGRRACRNGWRNRGDHLDMLAVVTCKDIDGSDYLGLQRETAELVEIWDAFSDIEDMQATDWFLEQEEAPVGCTCPKVCDCLNPPPDNWDGNGVYHVSNECPIHNDNPRPRPDCPVHVKNLPVETPS